MGTNQLVAQCRYLPGQVASLADNPSESPRRQKEAVKILTAVQKEAHTDLNGRYDQAPILSLKDESRDSP